MLCFFFAYPACLSSTQVRASAAARVSLLMHLVTAAYSFFRSVYCAAHASIKWTTDSLTVPSQFCMLTDYLLGTLE